MPLCSELDIRSEADVALARYRAGEGASLLGFSDQRKAEVRLIASELAQNHLDHCTSGGMIRISGQRFAGVPVLNVASLDSGPGIAAVAEVLKGAEGRFTSNTGLGAGLASVSRLADRFLCCSGLDPGSGCPTLVPPFTGTVIIGQCWPEGREPFFATVPGMDFAALVCPRAETMPCGDGVFIRSDSRFTRLVLVDSPGKGRGGGETQLIGSLVVDLDLVWPPDHVVEALAEVFEAEPATSLAVIRLDRLLGELRCCRVGSVEISLLLDGRLRPPPTRMRVRSGDLVRGTDSLYRVEESFSCLIHSDGLGRIPGNQVEMMLNDLLRKTPARAVSGRPHALLLAQVLLERYRNPLDDASVCLWSWQR